MSALLHTTLELTNAILEQSATTSALECRKYIHVTYCPYEPWFIRDNHPQPVLSVEIVILDLKYLILVSIDTVLNSKSSSIQIHPISSTLHLEELAAETAHPVEITTFIFKSFGSFIKNVFPQSEG